jgi:hypothetical protein
LPEDILRKHPEIVAARRQDVPHGPVANQLWQFTKSRRRQWVAMFDLTSRFTAACTHCGSRKPPDNDLVRTA